MLHVKFPSTLKSLYRMPTESIFNFSIKDSVDTMPSCSIFNSVVIYHELRIGIELIATRVIYLSYLVGVLPNSLEASGRCENI